MKNVFLIMDKDVLKATIAITIVSLLVIGGVGLFYFDLPANDEEAANYSFAIKSLVSPADGIGDSLAVDSAVVADSAVSDSSAGFSLCDAYSYLDSFSVSRSVDAWEGVVDDGWGYFKKSSFIGWLVLLVPFVILFIIIFPFFNEGNIFMSLKDSIDSLKRCYGKEKE